METLRIISLVLSIISGFSLSFIGGYLFGKYKEEERLLNWFERALKAEGQLIDAMTETENSNTKSEDSLEKEQEKWLISAACDRDRVNYENTKCDNCINHNFCWLYTKKNEGRK